MLLRSPGARNGKSEIVTPVWLGRLEVQAPHSYNAGKRRPVLPRSLEAGVSAFVESAAPAASQPGPVDEPSRVAASVKRLVLTGDASGAREEFADLVRLEQRRASRLAFYVLRNAADADEAVQDAFVKVFDHIASYREEVPFGVWFTRILINGCLDRRKARLRRERWLGATMPDDVEPAGRAQPIASDPSPEQQLLAGERQKRISQAVQALPGRQRLVFMLSQYDGRSPQEISAVTGMSESTIRVHLFRAVRKLRVSLEGLL